MELLDSHYFNDDRFVYSYFKTQSRKKDGWINNFSNKCFSVVHRVEGPLYWGYLGSKENLGKLLKPKKHQEQSDEKLGEPNENPKNKLL